MSNAQMDLYETEYFLLYQNLEVSLTHNFRHHFPFQKSEKMRLLKSGLLLGSTWGAYFLDKGIPDRRCKSDDPTTCVTIDLVSLTSHKPGTTLFSEIY